MTKTENEVGNMTEKEIPGKLEYYEEKRRRRAVDQDSEDCW